MYGGQVFERTVVLRRESPAVIKVEMLSQNCHGGTEERIEIWLKEIPAQSRNTNITP